MLAPVSAQLSLWSNNNYIQFSYFYNDAKGNSRDRLFQVNNSTFDKLFYKHLDKHFKHGFNSIRARGAEIQLVKDLDKLVDDDVFVEGIKGINVLRNDYAQSSYFYNQVSVDYSCVIIIRVILGFLSKISTKITRKYYEILANINWKEIKYRGFRKTQFLKRKRVINKTHQKVKLV